MTQYFGSTGVTRHQVLTHRVGTDRDHVLPCGIARMEVQDDVHEVGLQLDPDFEKPAVAGLTRGHFAHLLELAHRPGRELNGLPHRLELEPRCTLNLFDGGDTSGSAGQGDQAGAPSVAGDQRTLRRGERDVEVPIGVQPIDSERADQSGGDPGHPDVVLDVPLERGGIRRFGATRQVGQRPRSIFRKTQSLRRGGRARVAKAGNTRRYRPHLFGDGRELLLELGHGAASGQPSSNLESTVVWDRHRSASIAA